jgi:tetratricopeptide (TPR) repeat protein
MAPEDPLALFVTATINLCTCVSAWSKDIQEQQAIGMTAMEKYLRQFPDSPTMLLAKSDLYRRHDRYDESLLVADSVLRRDPENRAALIFKTDALMRLGRLNDALATSRSALEIGEDNAGIHALAAALHYRMKNYAEAAALAQKAITLMDRQQLANPIEGAVALTLIASEGQLGHRERAGVALRDFNANVPKATSIASIKEWVHPRASLARDETLYEGLRLAGIPAELR